MRLLVVEDFRPLRESLVDGLREAGYAVDEAGDGQTALWHAGEGAHDVIILDIMLPKIDGLSVLRELRQNNCPSMVLFLTAKDAPEDRVAGLELGADDYLVKPFVFAELLARVRAMVRRKYDTKSAIIRVADLEVNIAQRSASRAGRMLDLSNREFALLEYLAHNTGKIVSRSDIWQHVYDFNASPESNVVDVFIGLLRKKIERPGSPRLIHTRRGQGYLLAVMEKE